MSVYREVSTERAFICAS